MVTSASRPASALSLMSSRVPSRIELRTTAVASPPSAESWRAATSGAFKGESAIVALAVLAAVQVIVHVVFFLHVNSSKGQRWHAISFAYTILMSLILIVGTVWVMHNVHMLMMAR